MLAAKRISSIMGLEAGKLSGVRVRDGQGARFGELRLLLYRTCVVTGDNSQIVYAIDP